LAAEKVRRKTAAEAVGCRRGKAKGSRRGDKEETMKLVAEEELAIFPVHEEQTASSKS
jgi:hypothetical protein